MKTFDQYFKESLDAIAGIDNWEWNENRVEVVIKNADTNSQVRFKQILSFVETLNVELLRESSLTKLFDKFNLWDESYEDIIFTILDLKQHEWEKAIGTNGVKSYLSLHRRLQNIELATLIGATKFMGIGFGVRKAKALINDIGGDAAEAGADLWCIGVNDIEDIDGFDEKTAEKVVAGLKPTQKFVNSLLNEGYAKLVKVTKTDELKDMQVVMTGFRDADLAAEIEKRGGKIGSGVSKKTTYLLTHDANSNSGKSKKARDLGVTVMTPDDFKDKYNL